MDVVHYLRTLRRRWRAIVVAAALGAIVAFIFVPRPKSVDPSKARTVWLATQKFIANQSTPNNANNTGAGLSLDQMKLGVTTGDVPQRVAHRLGGDPSDYASRVHVVVNQPLRTLEIYVKGNEPENTEQVADAFGEELLTWIRELQNQRLEKDRQTTAAELEALRQEYDAVVGDDAVAQARRSSVLDEISSKEQRLRQIENAITSTGDPLTTLSRQSAFPTTGPIVATLWRSDDVGRGGQKQGSASNQPLTIADIQAKQPAGRTGLHPLLALLAGGLGGALLASVGVLAIAALDPRVFTKEQAEAAFGFPVIAEIPAFTRRQRRDTNVISVTAPYSRFAEAFRVLRSSIVFVERSGRLPDTDAAPPGATPREPNANRKRATVVMITSPGPSEGKTTTASNLAAVLAEDGSRVLVVNCDFRRPRLHLYLGAEHAPRKVIDTQIPGVKFVAGVVDDHRTATPAEVVKAQRDVVTAAREVFDYIILDTAPLLTTNDASDVLPVTDMVVVVCRAGKTTKEAADRAAELLERFNAPVIGAALVAAVDAPSARYYYYYASDEEPAPPTTAGNPLADLLAPTGEPVTGTSVASTNPSTADDQPDPARNERIGDHDEPDHTGAAAHGNDRSSSSEGAGSPEQVALATGDGADPDRT